MNRFVNLAINEAGKSKMSSRHGSVLVNKGRIVSVGHNSDRTMMAGIIEYYTCHSEMACLHRYRSGLGSRQRFKFGPRVEPDHVYSQE